MPSTCANNLLDFEERKAQGACLDLWKPPLKKASLADLHLGEHVVFSALDEFGKAQDCYGLAARYELIDLPSWIPKENKIYLFDNHNWTLFFMGEEKKRRNMASFDLIHMDQHRDSRPCEYELSPEENLEAFAWEKVNVGNYLDPMHRAGWIREFSEITSAEALNKKELLTSPNLFFNVDIDYFAPEMAYIPEEEAYAFVREAIRKAHVTCIATSPFFIDQKLALEHVKRILLG